MALIKWETRLETGHPKIDEQHRALVDAFNSLHGAMKQGKGREEVSHTLVFLKDYTVQHFQMEEDLMTRHAYPGAAKHKSIHRELVNQVADLVDKHTKGTMSLSMPVMDFLESWLVDHIQGEDLQLAGHLRGKI